MEFKPGTVPVAGEVTGANGEAIQDGRKCACENAFYTCVFTSAGRSWSASAPGEAPENQRLLLSHRSSLSYRSSYILQGSEVILEEGGKEDRDRGGLLCFLKGASVPEQLL